MAMGRWGVVLPHSTAYDPIPQHAAVAFRNVPLAVPCATMPRPLATAGGTHDTRTPMATKPAATERPAVKALNITPPDFRTISFEIEGTAPLVINRFSAKAMEMIRATQEAGSTAKSKKTREAKNFDALFEDAKHVSVDGWEGFAASSIRNAGISACRACSYVMTRAKLAFMVQADGLDRVDFSPLIRLTKGTAVQWVAPTRNATGVVDLRSRPMYPEWGATLRIRYDAGMFTETDVANLIVRIGMQVGIGEGRPDSKNSAGLGYGLFQVI